MPYEAIASSASSPLHQQKKHRGAAPSYRELEGGEALRIDIRAGGRLPRPAPARPGQAQARVLQRRRVVPQSGRDKRADLLARPPAWRLALPQRCSFGAQKAQNAPSAYLYAAQIFPPLPFSPFLLLLSFRSHSALSCCCCCCCCFQRCYFYLGRCCCQTRAP
jgi:hypothetical protein